MLQTQGECGVGVYVTSGGLLLQRAHIDCVRIACVCLWGSTLRGIYGLVVTNALTQHRGGAHDSAASLATAVYLAGHAMWWCLMPGQASGITNTHSLELALCAIGLSGTPLRKQLAGGRERRAFIHIPTLPCLALPD